MQNSFCQRSLPAAILTSKPVYVSLVAQTNTYAHAEFIRKKTAEFSPLIAKHIVPFSCLEYTMLSAAPPTDNIDMVSDVGDGKAVPSGGQTCHFLYFSVTHIDFQATVRN
jgi:hypothetical protein